MEISLQITPVRIRVVLSPLDTSALSAHFAGEGKGGWCESATGDMKKRRLTTDQRILLKMVLFAVKKILAEDDLFISKKKKSNGRV